MNVISFWPETRIVLWAWGEAGMKPRESGRWD
jgi:hypothetical protein